MSTLSKYFGQQSNEDHGAPLFWSDATGNVPFRGPYAPTLTKDELETQVDVVSDFNCQIFDLSNEDDRKRYVWIMDKIVNRWFVFHAIKREMIPGQKSVIVYLEWSQRYAELNPAAKAARKQGYTYTKRPNTNDDDFAITAPLAGLQDKGF